MQRIRVDFPEPEGPQITIRSPLWTVMFTSRRTWKLPYHLFIWLIWMATSSLTCMWLRSMARSMASDMGSVP